MRLPAGPWGCTVARVSWARVVGAAGGAGPRGGGVEGVLVVCGTPALVGVVVGAGGGGIRDGVVRSCVPCGVGGSWGLLVLGRGGDVAGGGRCSMGALGGRGWEGRGRGGDEVELFEKGVQVAARTAKRKGQAILSGDVVCMLRRFSMDDLRYWSIGYRKMWKVVAEANIALKELVDDTWCSENEHRFYLPALEEDLDEEHAAKYERLIETIEKRHHNVLVGIRAHNAAARVRGAPASDDGHLVRGCE